MSHAAECREVRVEVPDGAKVVGEPNRLNWSGRKAPVLVWAGDARPVRSTAEEVLELARAGAPGFRVEA